jgi:hypothetical protein
MGDLPPSGSTGDNSSVFPPRSDYHMNAGSHDFGAHDSRPQSSSSRNLSIRSFHTATDSQVTISSNYSGSITATLQYLHTTRNLSLSLKPPTKYYSKCIILPSPSLGSSHGSRAAFVREPLLTAYPRPNHLGPRGGAAGLIVLSYVLRIRDKLTLSDNNEFHSLSASHSMGA